MRNSTLAVALAALALAGCGGAAQQQDLASCRGDLADCRFRLDNASAGPQAQPGPAAAQPPPPGVAERLTADYRAIAAEINRALEGTDTVVFARDGKLVIQIPSRLLFPASKNDLSPEGRALLDRIAPVLTGLAGRDMLVACHREEPAGGAQASTKSREITAARALAVVRHLEKAGVDPSSIGGAGYGWHRPQAGNHTEEGREANRRTEIVIMPWLDEFAAVPEQL